jgi:hypothetical protein
MTSRHRNGYEDTDDHRRIISRTLHNLASHCHAAIPRHHHRERVTLLHPEVSHRIQRRPHPMGQPHSHRTHNYTLGLLGKWERMRIRFRDRPTERQLYTPRVGTRSLPLSLPHPSHHAWGPYRHRRVRSVPALDPSLVCLLSFVSFVYPVLHQAGQRVRAPARQVKYHFTSLQPLRESQPVV